MIRLYEVRLGIDESEEELRKRCEIKLGTKLKKVVLVKKSIDARKKNDVFYSCTADCEPVGKIKPQKGIRFKEAADNEYTFPKKDIQKKIIVVGTGPAGLFSALCLVRSGAEVIVIERGADVDSRVGKIDNFFQNSVLDPETNIQFGEGGAGTFSDGKLNTGINDARIKYVLKEFVRFGAPENILYDSSPHIGTDILRQVVKNIRAEIIRLGGKVLFNTKLVNINTENNCIKTAVVCGSDGAETEISCDKLILAIGHSARDTVKMLYKSGLKMEKKIFSVGMRIEHLQSDISRSLYGKFADKLPSAPYKLWAHLNDGNSLYTFCMCPGGYVVNSSSEQEMLVTNGMSYNARDGKNANSALLVNVKYSDDSDIFEGMNLQRKIESLAFNLAGSDYKMPVQLLGDFLAGKKSSAIGDIEPTAKPGYSLCDLNGLFPSYISETVKRGVLDFDRKINGFARYDAVLTGPETRSSSPVKFIRDKISFETNIKGIYSAGEGGGHAGGITSSAVDGIKVAECIATHI